MSARATSLRRRVTAAFLAAIAMTCLLFGCFGFIIAYSVEDRLFEDGLADEIAFQQAHWQRDRSFTRPARDYLALYRDPAEFPADLRTAFERAPRQREYSGEDGRHYHVARFMLPGGGGPAFAVAEVSRHLVVRPLRGDIIWFLGGWSLAILIVAGGIGYWLAGRATAPLTQLADAVAETGRGEIPHVRAADFPDNEIGRLAQALQHAFDRIRAFVARESGFTGDVSHELRTPLAVIRSSAELVETRGALTPSATRAVQRIAAAAQDMERTIDLLLALARETKARGIREQVDLLPLVEAALLDASDRYDGSAYRVEIAIPPDARVHADPIGLSLILANLIGNVFQHAPGGRLAIRCDGGRLAIVDTGPAITGERIAGTGKAFAKGAGGTGHGLGLGIVRRLCEREGIELDMATATPAGTAIFLRFGPGATDRD